MVDKTGRKEIIEKFLAFAEIKGITLGGDVIYGFALEHTEFRPMLRTDYPKLISDFIQEVPE